MIDVVLVEFEGVVADTAVARRTALRGALRDDGIVIDDAEYEEHCAFMPVRAAVTAALERHGKPTDETGVELATARAERRFAALSETGTSLVEGASELIHTLQSQGRRLAMVTRAARTHVERVLMLAGLDHAFEFIIANDDVFAPKPSPASYLAAIARLSRRRPVAVNGVVALEDGPTGIQAAKAAGLRCAAVGALPMHLAVAADALIPSLVGLSIASLDALTVGTPVAER